MLDKLTKFVRKISDSADFSYTHERGDPADAELLANLEEAFKRLGYKETPPALVKFYQTCNGFTLRWTYDKLTHPDYLTSGDVDIVAAELLISALYSEPPDPVRFDNASDLYQVWLRPAKTGPALVYRREPKRKDFPMTVGLDEYFRLLDESRGLYPWRELFIKSKSFRLEPVLREKFFADLKLLFKDADPSLFKQK